MENLSEIVSTLTLTELIGVLRTHLGRERDLLIGMDSKQVNEYVKSEAGMSYKQIFSLLMQIPSVKIEQGKKTNFQQILDEGFSLMEESIGLQKFYQKCGICRQSYQNSNYKQILVADLMHALLAKDTNCDELLTFDKGFKGIEDLERINPLKIIVR